MWLVQPWDWGITERKKGLLSGSQGCSPISIMSWFMGFTTQEKHDKFLFLKVFPHYEKQASGLHAFCKAHVANIKPVVTWNTPSNDIWAKVVKFLYLRLRSLQWHWAKLVKFLYLRLRSLQWHWAKLVKFLYLRLRSPQWHWAKLVKFLYLRLRSLQWHWQKPIKFLYPRLRS